LLDSTKGKRADLSSAGLRLADLRFADLRLADLRSADLSSANLCSADLRLADLRSANLRSADLHLAKTDDTFVVISCIGSRKDTTIFNVTKDIIWCGCYKGNLQDFENKVEVTHKDYPQFLKEYREAIVYFKTFLKEEVK